jgi:hypothetical protein
MVATDTVVGIVGAVLLVAVMAGVFAYEYNNPAPADATSDQGQKDSFAHKYAALNATDDIDGDGIPNYKDADMDGDGVSNANDTAVGVAIKVAGTIPTGPTAPGSPAAAGSTPFNAGTGVVHVLAFVNYTASPLPVQQYSLQASLLDSAGKSVASGTATTTGGRTTIKIDTSDVMAGAYKLVVSMTGADPQGGTYDGVIQVHYDAGMSGMAGMSH